MYEDGTGVSQDYVEAYKWYTIAAERTGDRAREFSRACEELAGKMTPAQVSDAQKRARDWLDAFSRRKEI
jgi:TPR repeat protein